MILKISKCKGKKNYPIYCKRIRLCGKHALFVEKKCIDITHPVFPVSLFRGLQGAKAIRQKP